MPLPEPILRAWAETDYRVRVPRGGYASIRIGAALPAALRRLLHDETQTWGFITAWNPASMAQPRARNRDRQRVLRDALREGGYAIRVGVGMGADGWREPSLFVCDIDFDSLDALAKRFGQAAVVRGVGNGPAELRVSA